MHVINVLCLTLILTLSLVVAGCSKKKDPQKVRDLNSVRTGLREQVASGDLTREEAIVRLAEATKEAKFGSRDKDRPKKKAELSPELEAFGRDLKEKMAKGKLMEEEAKAAWEEAAEEAKGEPKSQGAKESAKGKE